MEGESPLHTDVLILCRDTWAFCVTPEDRLVPDQALCGNNVEFITCVAGGCADETGCCVLAAFTGF